MTRFRRWWILHRIRRAARLMERGAIGAAEYGALVVEAVAKLLGEKLRRERGWNLITFAVEAHLAIAPTIGMDGALDAGFGPVEHAVQSVAECFPMPAGGGDEWRRREFSFVWGDGADALLRQAKRHERAVNRWYESLDRWRGEQARIAPNLHKDAWWAVIAIITFILGVLFGRSST